MKHKHSPNFHTNLEEADNAKNNRAATFFWTVVTISLFLLGFSLTSCTKEASKPIELRPPQRSVNTVDVTIKFFVTSHPLAPGNLYGLQIRSSKTLTQQTTFYIQWKDGVTTWKLSPFIHAGQSAMDWHTMIPIVKGASDLRLIRVEGDTSIVYRLKQIL